MEVLSFLQQVYHLEMCQAGPGQPRSSAEHAQLKRMATQPRLSPGVSLLPCSWGAGRWCRKGPTMQTQCGESPTMQIHPCWQPGAGGQPSGAGFAELVPYCCPTSRREDLLLVAGSHGENMVPSEPGLWWQGGEDVRAPAMTRCIAAREGAAISPAGLRAVGQRRNIGVRRGSGSRKGVFGTEKEHLGPGEASSPGEGVSVVWWPRAGLADPAAAPQGWEHNVVLMLSWGGR